MKEAEPNVWAPPGDGEQGRKPQRTRGPLRPRARWAVGGCLAALAITFGLLGLKEDPFFAFVLAIDGCEKRAEVEGEELRALAKDLFGEATGRWVVSACGSVPGVSLRGPPAPGLAFADAPALLSDAGCLRLST